MGTLEAGGRIELPNLRSAGEYLTIQSSRQVSWAVLTHPFTEALSIPIHGRGFMPHGDTALVPLPLHGVWTLGVRVVETTGHGGRASLREVWTLVVLRHIELHSWHSGVGLSLYPFRLRMILFPHLEHITSRRGSLPSKYLSRGFFCRYFS